jgi:L-ascorbate metabolism protein UlaG (beta-lactamase superfamily)
MTQSSQTHPAGSVPEWEHVITLPPVASHATLAGKSAAEQAATAAVPGGEEAKLEPGVGSLFFIGNATLLLRWAGFTILTDPTFIHKHEETWLGYGLTTKRLTDPAIEIEQLPPIDFVLLSHFHGDHFDQRAEAQLDKGLLIVTPPDSARQLGERGFTNCHALEPWQSVTLRKGDATLRITATPGRHGPPLSDYVLPDVMGSLLEFGQTHPEQPASEPFRLYITGDTLVYDEVEEIPRRYPVLDLALLHLGGTRVMGILVTMDAEQGVRMLELVNPKTAIPIHYDDYDVFKSPLSDFQRAVTEAGLTDRVHYLARGESYQFHTQNRRI